MERQWRIAVLRGGGDYKMQRIDALQIVAAKSTEMLGFIARG